MMIFSLVAMTGLEKCCITSALCSGYVIQVSDLWPVGLLLFLTETPICISGQVQKSRMEESTSETQGWKG